MSATAISEVYTLSLHDALPISIPVFHGGCGPQDAGSPCHMKAAPAKSVARARSLWDALLRQEEGPLTSDLLLKDRKSTRLNSSHITISYAVFCLKKKNTMRSTEFCRTGREIQHVAFAQQYDRSLSVDNRARVHGGRDLERNEIGRAHV